ncbi:helix-turn-helix transcriptional regulator [Marinicrinis sediminis]|uniref:AraC family transcriptional regulator n=1 Tax=Marinicrinis sediminis TaxID=1652465 RepID=A0ABW5REZ8_9BACL
MDISPQNLLINNIEYKHRAEDYVGVFFHSHPQHEIFYFHEGECNYLIGDKIYMLQPGDLIIMNGMTLHCAKVSRRQPYVRSVIHFEPSFVREWFQLPCTEQVLQPFQQLNNARVHLTGAQRTEMEELLVRLADRQQKPGERNRDRSYLAFYDLMLFISGCFSAQMKQGENKESSEKVKAVQNMITYLAAHYMDDIHLETLEEAIHLDKYYMSKIFKEITGVTIFTYLYERRINESRILLYLNPQQKVTDISYQVGFKHPAHFSRVFKQHVGCTPDQFRKQMQAHGQTD